MEDYKDIITDLQRTVRWNTFAIIVLSLALLLEMLRS